MRIELPLVPLPFLQVRERWRKRERKGRRGKEVVK